MGGVLHDLTGGYRTGFVFSLCAVALAVGRIQWMLPVMVATGAIVLLHVLDTPIRFEELPVDWDILSGVIARPPGSTSGSARAGPMEDCRGCDSAEFGRHLPECLTTQDAFPSRGVPCRTRQVCAPDG